MFHRHIFIRFVACWFCLLAGCNTLFGLASEYERNGEVYVLVGDGAKIGVYRLNDPAGEGVPTGWLYNPLQSYGISVNLSRKVYTFSETATSTFSLLTGNISVLMKANGANIMDGFHYDHRGNWGELGTPMYTTPGTGKWYVAGWGRENNYHGAGTFSAVTPQCTISSVNVIVPDGAGYGSIPNAQWYQSSDNDTYGRPGKAYRDRVEGAPHDYHLLEWYQGIAANTPADKGVKATSYEKKVQRALLGSCIDPCGTNVASLSMGAATQTVSLALSSFGRTYCYTRTEAMATDGKVTLDGTNYAGPVIGTINNLTTKWIGVSLRNTSADYVYVLGTDVIKSWLTQLGFTIPTGFNVTAVSVSDQWYLKGGIVFAYNNSNGIAYQFTRADNADGTASGTSYFTSVNLGSGIDDIK
ncbi:MAG TPA: hypothetical protein PKO06_21595, partial [Candidatus Ozemobacteraceae bacterium]|nr:hypothetical protein [Candidatus Ozemobacteraceae bacterium]